MDEMMLDRLLARAASETPYPVTPDLRARVATAISNDSQSERRQSPRIVAPRFALSLAGLALAAIAVLVLALPSSRSAVADFFGIEGSKIERLPTTVPGTTPTPFPTPAGIESFATPSSIEAISQDFGFIPAVPSSDGAFAVYSVEYFDTLAVVLSYERFDLWEVRLQPGGTFNKGQPIDPVFNKAVGGGTRITDLTVHDRPAVWISGGAHIVRFTDANGREAAASARTIDRNTLIWRSDAAFYRLETDLPLDDARRIAESLP